MGNMEENTNMVPDVHYAGTSAPVIARWEMRAHRGSEQVDVSFGWCALSATADLTADAQTGTQVQFDTECAGIWGDDYSNLSAARKVRLKASMKALADAVDLLPGL